MDVMEKEHNGETTPGQNAGTSRMPVENTFMAGRNRNLTRFVTQNNYHFLLFSLVLLLAVPPFLRGTYLEKVSMEGCLTLVLLASANYLRELRKILRYTITIGMVAFIFNWISFVIPKDLNLQGMRNLFFGMFFLIIFFQLLKTIWKSEVVDAKVVSGAITAYLLLGIVGAFAFLLVDLFYPGSFNVPIAGQSLFFSFITITTTGYGNIYPVRPQAETVSYIFAITGQIYMTVLVAIIVGKYLMHSNDRKNQ
jgi:voltage-gated potassium channel